MLTKITQIKSSQINVQYKPLFDILMEQCQNKIELFDLKMRYQLKHIDQYRNTNVNANNNEKRLQVQLLNAHSIHVGCSHLDIKWSHKCQYLMLQGGKENWDFPSFQKWFDYVISNCDCSGVEFLQVDKMSFSLLNRRNIVIYQTNPVIEHREFEQWSATMQMFAQKFDRLKRVQIRFEKEYDLGVLLFWKMLKPIVEKNNGKIEVIFARRSLNKPETFEKIDAIIQQPYFTIKNIDDMRSFIDRYCVDITTIIVVFIVGYVLIFAPSLTHT